jgi:hypothetical protein
LKITYYFGLILFAIALYFTYRSIQKYKAIRACNDCRVEATIVDNKPQVIYGNMFVHYPVYEYEIDGETHTFQSQYSSVTPMKLGMKIKLYYNKGTREPVEQVSVVGEITLAMVFIIAASILLNIKTQ